MNIHLDLDDIIGVVGVVGVPQVWQVGVLRVHKRRSGIENILAGLISMSTAGE